MSHQDTSYPRIENPEGYSNGPAAHIEGKDEIDVLHDEIVERLNAFASDLDHDKNRFRHMVFCMAGLPEGENAIARRRFEAAKALNLVAEALENFERRGDHNQAKFFGDTDNKQIRLDFLAQVNIERHARDGE